MPGLEIIEATFGTLDYFKNVVARLRDDVRDNRLVKTYYYQNFGKDPRMKKNKVLKIKYRLNGDENTIEIQEEPDGKHAIRVNIQ